MSPKIPKITVFVQARTGSTRLPGKVMNKIIGKEVLLYHIARIRLAKTIHEVVVITTVNSADDMIVALCEQNGIKYYRGSESDLLDRHYQAAKQYGANFVIKIPSDSPLTDPKVIDTVVGLWKDNQDKYDYVSNYHPPTFPDGLDVEGCPFTILEIAWKEAKKSHEREHTFPFIWDQPERFRIGNILNPHGDMFMTHRWTLDYAEDFDFMKAVFEHFKDKPDFSMEDVLQLLKEQPALAEMNSKYNGVNWYRNVPGKLKTVGKDLFNDEPTN
ncbi:MAG: Polysaccharide biosynthesis protein [Candidatus Magasanikbacteria bacterium GW2011_GWA2_45_39]|uniref:Polysaccharide biosynthesis protein n=1 Tax=Candidatus Magasanikbacteria bacterium GW2011_GWA2_45_39 TaxID=1619041 RepID=A0A0G1MI44_9BACT|nr:MAG: Polysaccharide biosynthesis protein [Candidatus Magasanikbacteria bacterium GW2011_GWA2_45_39]